MEMQVIPVYADTSVFGGVLDPEFSEPSRMFFQQVRGGRFALRTSAVVQAELENAPAQVKELYEELLPLAEIAEVSEEALRLQQAYLSAGIVPAKWSDDALHVAVATVCRCSVIVSWNFEHIVHFQKIPLYNAVNEINGHRAIAICSPREVIAYEDQDV